MSVRERVTLSNHSELFKEFYIPIMEAAINTATPYRTQLKRIKNFTGSNIKGVVRLSRGGGVGNRVIPRSSTRKSSNISYTPKALWATSVLDWEAMVSSGDDKGAFVDVTVDEVEGTMEAFTNNENRQFFGTHNGIIGVLDGVVTDNGSLSYTFAITDASWFQPNWEPGMVINFHTDNASGFEVTSVDIPDQEVTVLRRDGAFDPTTLAGTENLYMQNSKDEELTGLKEIADAVEGDTLFGLTCQYRYVSRKMAAGGKPLVPDMLTEMCAQQDEQVGKMYDAIVINSMQLNSLENQLEGKKEFTQLKSSDSRYADIGWEALTLRFRGKKVAIIPDLYCPKDRVYFTTKDKTEVRERPKFGWLQFDGKQYLRNFTVGEVPKYEASYGGYEQFFHHPAYLGVITGLEEPAFG